MLTEGHCVLPLQCETWRISEVRWISTKIVFFQEHADQIRPELLWIDEIRSFNCRIFEFLHWIRWISHWQKYSDPLLWPFKFTPGASNFCWSSLRCFCTLIAVHLWWMPLIGPDLERLTPVYIRSQSWQCRPFRPQWQNFVETQIWGNWRLKVPKSTAASIFLDWKKFGNNQDSS